ncbi:MAG: arginine deiminase-related protein [Spirochaetota bacterium]|nr:arginine deiminase-related protein [Spirochaetota bacterium]
MEQHTILMGDPFFFSIQGGANPHTRDRFGIKKKVDRTLAIKQWHNLAELLIDHGIQIFIISPQIEHPGLVYPANAGFMANVLQDAPLSEKVFYLSNLLESRAGEQPYYKEILEGIGINTAGVSKRFEGEADLFPVGKKYIFTHGEIKKQKFKFHFGFPPYKRVYGFRSDYNLLNELKLILGKIIIVPITLINENYYHGDTLLCSFGKDREYLLAYLEGISSESQALCKREFGDQMIVLSDDDAKLYAANSFQTVFQNELYLFMPKGVSKYLIDQIKERGVKPVLVDVSEFLKKGGGSIKCMVCDLGIFIDSKEVLPEKVKIYREKHRYENYYNKI